MGLLDETGLEQLVGAGCRACGSTKLVFHTYVDGVIPFMAAEPVGRVTWIYDGEKFVDGVYAVACAACGKRAFEADLCPRCHAPGGLARARHPQRVARSRRVRRRELWRRGDPLLRLSAGARRLRGAPGRPRQELHRAARKRLPRLPRRLSRLPAADRRAHRELSALRRAGSAARTSRLTGGPDRDHRDPTLKAASGGGAYQPEDHQEKQRADERDENGPREPPEGSADVESPKEVSADERAHDTDDDVANHAEAATRHHRRQPSRDEADRDPDQKRLNGH